MKSAKSKRVTAAELSRIADYSPASITAWTRSGILQRSRGRYDLAGALKGIKRHELRRGSDGGHDTGELGRLKRQLLEKKIERLDHELRILRGEVHDRRECVASLGYLLSGVWTEIKSLPGRAQAALPEASGLETLLVNIVNEAAGRITDFVREHGAEIKDNKPKPGNDAGNKQGTQHHGN